MGLDAMAREVRITVYRRLAATGRAPSSGEIASGLGVSQEEVESALERLQQAHALVLAPGTRHVWMAHPFSAAPTSFRVETQAAHYWANCAWDALSIPALLGADATTSATCADCAAPLTFTFRAGELVDGGGLVHFAVPPKRFWENVAFT